MKKLKFTKDNKFYFYIGGVVVLAIASGFTDDPMSVLQKLVELFVD